MADPNKPISSSNPPESKGSGKKFPEVQHAVTGEERVVLPENDDNTVPTVTNPEPAPAPTTATTRGTKSKGNTSTKTYTTTR